MPGRSHPSRIVLPPDRYVDPEVRSSGASWANLYGDLPQGRSTRPLGLRAAVGRRGGVGHRRAPEGRGFDLDPGARVDTGRWLEVTVPERRARGIEG